MNVYVADIWSLSPHRQEALALLEETRREKALAQRRPEGALRSLCAGLLLRRFVGSKTPSQGPHGKPCLPGGPCFNLSHGGDLAVLAVGEEPVGVDVERRTRRVHPAVPPRILTPEERRWLALEPEDGLAFLWTRKEAALKCSGRGLSLPLSSFSVLPGMPCRVDGREYRLETLSYVNHFISVAAPSFPDIRLIPVGPETLLSWPADPDGH